MNEIPNRNPDGIENDTVLIREANDRLRKRMEGGRIVMTQGVAALSEETIARVFAAIQSFDDFNEANDPYGTHEFGIVEVEEDRVMFKIDAYDKNLEYGSPNPADPEVTERVMTVLLPSEY